VLNDNVERLSSLKEELNYAKETGLLVIESDKKQENLLQLAQDIKNLLSLALGKGIIFDRQVYRINNEEKVVTKKMSDPSNEGNQIIPSFELENFLTQTLPNWTNLEKPQKDELFIVIDYLNQTRHGFIADRILRATQAWESLTESWDIKGELDNRLIDLQTNLKATYKEWRNHGNNKQADLNGELGNKISSAINQEKLLSKLIKLSNNYGLKIEGLNLKELKRLRDKVVHTGNIDIPGKKAIHILTPAITGLQIIILRFLGYSGKIISSKQDWETHEYITDFTEKKNNGGRLNF
jgi:hypothetical protein